MCPAVIAEIDDVSMTRLLCNGSLPDLEIVPTCQFSHSRFWRAPLRAEVVVLSVNVREAWPYGRLGRAAGVWTTSTDR